MSRDGKGRSSDPRDRLISLALAALSLVVVVPFVIAMAAPTADRPIAGDKLVLAVVHLLARLGVAAWLLAQVARDRIPHWRRGGLPTLTLMILVGVLGALPPGEVNLIEDELAKTLGLSDRESDVVTGLTLAVAVALFAVMWSRTPSTQSASTGRDGTSANDE